MSVPYWHHSRCGQNTEIPKEIIERVRNKDGSFNDLMTCGHCGSTPEKRKARSDALLEGMKSRAMERARLRPERADKAELWEPSESLKTLAIQIIRNHLLRGVNEITSWWGFGYAQFEIKAIPESIPHSRLLQAMRAGKKMGWLEARWIGTGMTPWAGSARRQRVYDITDKAKEIIGG